jgi:hypothetical protein
MKKIWLMPHPPRDVWSRWPVLPLYIDLWLVLLSFLCNLPLVHIIFCLPPNFSVLVYTYLYLTSCIKPCAWVNRQTLLCLWLGYDQSDWSPRYNCISQQTSHKERREFYYDKRQ